MHTTLVYVKVKQENLAEFIEITRFNHENSIKEPGNRRFDILQSADDPTSFVFYEAYINKEAVSAHKETSYYKAWRDAVTNWMAEPRYSKIYNGLYPAS